MSPDQLRKKVHLRARSPAFSALLRLRSKMLLHIHDYFTKHGYVHIDTPLITRNDCEGAGETFSVVAPSSSAANDDFFGGADVYLSVSGQLHLEAMVSGISHVYTVSTAIRADRQQSRNHLTEFRMLEAEIAFCNELEQLLEVVEKFLLSSIRNLITDPDMTDDLRDVQSYSLKDQSKLLHRIAEMSSFPRITYADTVSLLSEKEQAVISGRLSKQNEAFLVEHFKSPVFVTHFPSNRKPFYMLRCADGNLTESFDLLCPTVGELAGGSIREPSFDAVHEPKPDISWYLELRERGKPISGGFGLGFERLLQFLLGVPNIKDTIPFPRWYKHCQC